MTLYVFDVHGTLVDVPPDIRGEHYESPAWMHANTRPHPRACRYVRALVEHEPSAEVAFLTAVSQDHEPVLADQLFNQANVPRGPIICRSEPAHEFPGFLQATVGKTARLIAFRVEHPRVVMHGDAWMDRRAAEWSGTEFVHAHMIRGEPAPPTRTRSSTMPICACDCGCPNAVPMHTGRQPPRCASCGQGRCRPDPTEPRAGWRPRLNTHAPTFTTALELHERAQQKARAGGVF